MRKAIGAVCITVLCAALLTGCSNTAGSVSESLNEENSSSSQQAYSEEISDNESMISADLHAARKTCCPSWSSCRRKAFTWYQTKKTLIPAPRPEN